MSKRAIIVIIFVTLFGVVQAQQGELNVSAGPLISFVLTNHDFTFQAKRGVGLEAIGQYNFTNRSAVVTEVGFASYNIKNNRLRIDTGTKYRRTIYSPP